MNMNPEMKAQVEDALAKLKDSYEILDSVEKALAEDIDKHEYPYLGTFYNRRAILNALGRMRSAEMYIEKSLED